VARAPVEIGVVGRSYFQVGDGGGAAQPGRLTQAVFSAPMAAETLPWAAEFTGDAVVTRMRDAVAAGRHLALGTTIHDGAGIAILRTGEAPERAAAGITYGDPTGHRHMDLLDAQLFAFERQFLTDLGYPQSWASFANWEANWATHNTAWGVVPGVYGGNIGGRGRLVRLVEVDGVRLLEVVAERWAWDEQRQRWYRPGVAYRRLLALVETDGQGVALIDLMRIQGGVEHWRICRGLQGRFDCNLPRQARAGTLAGEHVVRGAVSDLARPDYAGLAYMDEVTALEAPGAWTGRWQHHSEADTALDLHQLASTSPAAVAVARATAIMGTPGESPYEYRALCWRTQPADAHHVTKVDLVYEPRVGPATLIAAETMSAVPPDADDGLADPPAHGEGGSGADGDAQRYALPQGAGGSPVGVRLRTRGGREVAVYWAPNASPDHETRFDDGTVLAGALAVNTPAGLAAQASRRACCQGRALETARPCVTAQIIAVDANRCQLSVREVPGAKAGDRVIIEPGGRGHNYLVEAVDRDGAGMSRLTLDVTPLLGRCRVKRVVAQCVELDFLVMARSGNLEGVRLVCPSTGVSAAIVGAWNPDGGSTTVTLDRILDLGESQWVELLTCVPGDALLIQPVATTP
jgi:hypothetical protein